MTTQQYIQDQQTLIQTVLWTCVAGWFAFFAVPVLSVVVPAWICAIASIFPLIVAFFWFAPIIVCTLPALVVLTIPFVALLLA